MKTIKLASGDLVHVDDADYEVVSKFTWSIWRKKGMPIQYAKRMHQLNGKRKTIYMHREILGLGVSLVVDHIDGNGLNNQRANMRACSRAQNIQNRRKHAVGISRFKGVVFHSRCKTKPWAARIKQKHLGMFATEVEAASVHNEAAIRMYGEFANLNLL